MTPQPYIPPNDSCTSQQGGSSRRRCVTCQVPRPRQCAALKGLRIARKRHIKRVPHHMNEARLWQNHHDVTYVPSIPASKKPVSGTANEKHNPAEDKIERMSCQARQMQHRLLATRLHHKDQNKHVCDGQKKSVLDFALCTATFCPQCV